MRRILLLCSLILLAGCNSTPKVRPLVDADSWQIPVTPAKVMENAENPASKAEQGTLEEIITVPASTVPTRIEVYKKKPTLKQKAKELFTNTPTHEVKADNPRVKAQQPKKTVWWRWVAALIVGLFILAAMAMAVVQKFTSFSPWGAVLKLFKK